MEVRYPPSAVQAVAQAVGADDVARAAALADAALANGLNHPILFIARALRFERQARDEDALAAYQQARALAPKDPRLLNAIGLCLLRLHRYREALAAFDRAVHVKPAASATHQNRGLALGMAGRAEDAERAHTRAVRLDPRNVEALTSLASIAAHKGEAGTARDYAERALEIDSRNLAARASLALAEVSLGQFADAESRLRLLVEEPGLTGHARAVAFALLGDALDGQDRCPDAFAAYTAANTERRKLHQPRFRGMPGAIDTLEHLAASFGATSDDQWRAPGRDEPAQGAVRHIFLLGFFRSGTTLLGQVLDSHPGIVTLDERDFLADMAERTLNGADGFARLSASSEDELAIHRKTYWQRVRDQGLRVEGKVFVDKHPFHTIKLPLIFKLFPHAKVLFALRDPRDVVLSCFRRQLDVDQLKFEFLTLEGAARLYDCVMRFGELCRRKLPLAILDHRYEDLVGAFDDRTRTVCDFIGVPWSDSMHDFAAAAQSLGAQKPSARQVRRGLYSAGAGRWRQYRSQLEPVLPLLEPWIERFGYSGE
ncbi:MAG TPA: sulfotransferase [Rhizomicrobium sp.]|nr:sulfotransferase [Rhizomicrobium sp.]